jgi:hypothetical protein
MENKSLLVLVYSETELNMVKALLEQAQIEFESHGGKAYAQIVAGGDHGEYKIYVDEKSLETARNILPPPPLELATPVNDVETEAEGPIERTPEQDLKRAIMFSVIGFVVLPVIFNLLSIAPFVKFYKGTASGFSKALWTLIYLSLNLILLPCLLYILAQNINWHWIAKFISA